MKIPLIVGILLLLAVRIPAQTAGEQNPQFSVVHRDANSRMWVGTNYVRDVSGQTVTNVHRYTELATGLHYQKNGEWVESKENIEILPQGGASATEGRHHTYFPADIYDGVLEVVTPDGRHMQSRPMGVSYDDGSNIVWIAQLQHSTGLLTSSNQITYPDAFTGIKADLVCTYRLGGFECDLVLRQQAPTPDQFGLNPNASTLQLVTEFFNTQDPQQIPAKTDDWYGLQDNTLKFGKMTMTHGKAFSIKTSNSNNVNPAASISVYKHWLHMEGRTFLVEEVPLDYLAPELSTLPSATNALSRIVPPASGILYSAGRSRLLPRRRELASGTNRIQIASVNLKSKPGVVLDYNEIDSDTNDFTFESNTTYYVSAPLNLNGTTIIQGGAVIKIPEGYNAWLICNGDVQCQTTAEHPAVFTSVNDDSVGNVLTGISSGTPNPSGSIYLQLFSPISGLSNVRMKYQNVGVFYSVYDGTPLSIADSQFEHTGTGCYPFDGDADVENFEFDNVLFYDCWGICYAEVESSINVSGRFVTMDQITQGLVPDADWEGFTISGSLQNSLLTAVGATNNLTLDYCAVADSNSGVYKTAAAADHYLATTSSYRNVGTTGYEYLRAGSTTYAPQDGGHEDTDGIFDLGYHYPVNEDSDYDGLPDWWELKYYGSFSKTSSDLDDEKNGNTLLYDYQNGIDPRVIEFSIGVTNNYIRTNVAAMNLNVIAGRPFSIAVLVASTNFNGASWSSYASSNLTETLGTTDGVYSVWVGLRGSYSNSMQTWHEIEFTLDRVPPVISITNIVSGSTVHWSLLQVQGGVSEPAAGIAYDSTNAAGLMTNQEVYITRTMVDTNLTKFTTNYFQAYDVFLADGTNTMTFRATDLAGNMSSTNLVVILDTSTATNPPAITVDWPDTNYPIAGTNFMLSGRVDDPTATVMVSGNGFTNLMATVERDGRFTVAGVPLLASNNTFTVNVTNKAGIGLSTSGAGGSRSSVMITVAPIQSGQISHDFMTLRGTVSDTNKDVWVNGVQASVNTNGTWQASNVPVKDNGGTQELNIGAYPVGSDPNTTAPSGVQNPIVPLPAVVQASGYTRKYSFSAFDSCGGNHGNTDNQSWERGIGGWEHISDWEPGSSTNYSDSWGTEDYLPASPWSNISTSTGDGGVNILPGECPGGIEAYVYTTTESVQTTIELVAGGPAVPGQTQLVRLTMSATDDPILASALYSPDVTLTPTATNDYIAEGFVEIPSGGTKKITLAVAGAASYSFDAQPEPVSLRIVGSGNGVDYTDQTTNVIVGQPIQLNCRSSMTNLTLSNIAWTVPGYAISNYIADANAGIVSSNFPTNSSNVVFYWVDGASARAVKCSATINGKQATAKAMFNVLRPEAHITALSGTVSLDHDFYISAANTNVFGLHYGNANHGPNGVKFFRIVNIPAGFTGTNQWVQVINTLSRGHLNTNGFWYFRRATNVLDTFYPQNITTPNATTTSDNPGEGIFPIDTAISANDSYSMWLMFQPTGGIPVPLRVINWSWGGSGSLSGTNWAETNWVLNTSSNTNSDDLDAGIYPQWTNNIINLTNYVAQP